MSFKTLLSSTLTTFILLGVSLVFASPTYAAMSCDAWVKPEEDGSANYVVRITDPSTTGIDVQIFPPGGGSGQRLGESTLDGGACVPNGDSFDCTFPLTRAGEEVQDYYDYRVDVLYVDSDTGTYSNFSGGACDGEDHTLSAMLTNDIPDAPGAGDAPRTGSEENLSYYRTLTPGVLDELNPLVQFGDTSKTGDLSTPGNILNRFLGLFAFPLAGLILFLMLVWGGFEILFSSAGKKSIDSGKQRITAALTGFVLLFCSYWIIKVIEVVFGVSIL